ncbi:MAG: hypothetical protein ACTHKF_11475 [Candidatus Nitrosocosmicus sp.]
MSVKIMIRQVITCHGCGIAIKAYIGKVFSGLDRRVLSVLKWMADLFVHTLITPIIFVCPYK